MSALNEEEQNRQRFVAALNRLMVRALGYVATASRQPLDARLNAASQLMTELNGQAVPTEWISSEWDALSQDRQAALGEIASWSAYLSAEHKELLIFLCARLITGTRTDAQREWQAIDQLRAALRISPERADAASNAAVAMGPVVKEAPPPPKPPAPPTTSQRAAVPETPRQTSTTMAAGQHTKRGRKWVWWVAAIAFVGLLIGGVFYADFLYDRDQYAYGYEAYRRGDCITANSYMSRITTGSLFGGMGITQNQAQPLAATIAQQCVPVAKGQQAMLAGEFDAALAEFLNSRTYRLPQFLQDSAQQSIQSIVTSVDPGALASVESCQQAEKAGAAELFGANTGAVPVYLLACAEAYAGAGYEQPAFDTNVMILQEYPASQEADVAASSILESEQACEQRTSFLETSTIAEREPFMGELYLACGKQLEDAKNFEAAVELYQEFTDHYEEHAALEDIKMGLARSLFMYALSLGAPEIPEPGRSGTTRSGETVVIIQNDAPESMRLSFSGPDARIEELGACTNCRKFTSDAEAKCQDLGPVGTYTLAPGTYNVVVESTSNKRVIPFIGTWVLESGNEYSHCFYIVTSPTP